MRRLLYAIALLPIFVASGVHAAVFDSIRTIEGVGFPNLEDSWRMDTEQRWPQWSWSSSTAQVFINDVSLRAAQASGSPVMPKLLVHTSQGDWEAQTTSTINGAAYTTTTYYFANGNVPFGNIGEPFDFALAQLGEQLELQQIFIAGTTNTLSDYTESWQYIDSGANRVDTLAGGTPYAPAMIINDDDRGVIQAIDFTNAGYQLNTSTPSENKDFGFFGNAIRDLLIWLFQPPATVTAQYSAVLADIRMKVPWGWWDQVSTGFGSVSSSESATTTALSMEVPHNGVTTTVDIFDVATVTSIIPASVLDLIRSLGGVALWALFAAWIWSLVTGTKIVEDEL